MNPSTMEEGYALLNAGQTLDALVCFLEVRDEFRQDHDGSSNADIEQMLGICYRMLKRYAGAERAFRIALALTDDPVHKGRIERDRAMVPLEQRQFDMAERRLESSMDYLRMRNSVEYFTSVGFLGRMYVTSKKQWLRTSLPTVGRPPALRAGRAAHLHPQQSGLATQGRYRYSRAMASRPARLATRRHCGKRARQTTQPWAPGTDHPSHHLPPAWAQTRALTAHPHYLGGDAIGPSQGGPLSRPDVKYTHYILILLMLYF